MTTSSEALLVAIMGKVDALAVEIAETRHEIRSHDERMRTESERFSERLTAAIHRPAVAAPVWNAQNVKLALVAVLVLALGNLGADTLREIGALIGRLLGWVK